MKASHLPYSLALVGLIEEYERAAQAYYEAFASSYSDPDAERTGRDAAEALRVAEARLAEALPGTDTPPYSTGVAYGGRIYSWVPGGQVVAINILQSDDGTCGRLAAECAEFDRESNSGSGLARYPHQN